MIITGYTKLYSQITVNRFLIYEAAEKSQDPRVGVSKNKGFSRLNLRAASSPLPHRQL